MSNSIKNSEALLLSKGPSNLLNLVRGEGIYIWDDKGRRYIDGSSGPICVSIGHGLKEITDAVRKQMEKLSFAHHWYFTTDSVIECAEKLTNFAQPGFDNVFFTSGGSESTEAAVKLARQYFLEKGEPSRYKVIARWQSYHGNTLGALSLSGHIGRRKKYIPMLIDFPHIPPTYCYRCWFGKTRDTCDLECARFLNKEIKFNDPKHVAAFIAEPVVGSTLGTVPAPEGYFQLIREICDRHDLLFITDEVMTGFGRTGKKFGIDHWGVRPDIIATAKGLSSGYLPLGAVLASNEISETFKSPFAHGHTYGGHPVACAVGKAVINYIEKYHIVEKSAELGKYLLRGLEDLYDHPSVGDVRGLGIFAGIEFVRDKTTKEPFHPDVKFAYKVLDRCLENGLFVYPGTGTIDGIRGDHIQIAPPLVVTKNQIDEIIEIIDKSLNEVERDVY